MGILRADRITGLGGADAITGSTFFGGGVSAESGSASQNNLQLDISSDFNLGTNNFTIEAFIYLEALGQFNNILAVGTDSTNGYRMDLGTGNNLRLVTKLGSDSWGVLITGSTTFIKDKWYHVAVTRSGNSFDLWVDGTKDATTVTNSGAFSDATVSSANSGTNNIGVEIGSLSTYGLSRKFNGYISNLHLVNGTALYTSNYTIPTTRLEKRSDTVILTCNSAGNVLNEETGKTIIKHSANINSQGPVASRFTPNSPVGFSTTTDVGSQYGLTFDGFGSFATSTYMVPPGGNMRERNRGRGVFIGGGGNNNIDYIIIQSQGNAIDFGDKTSLFKQSGCVASSTRSVNAGGFENPAFTNIMDFITIANTANATDFGDLTLARRNLGGAGNSTRGIFFGGGSPSVTDTIDFITIATAGNASDFGNTTSAKSSVGSFASPTRAVFGGGESNAIEYLTIATTGNATDFGDLISGTTEKPAGTSSSTRGLFICGESQPSGTRLNTIQFVTIATTGNATDFGDHTDLRRSLAACNNSIRAVYGGGNTAPANTTVNTLSFVTIATAGNGQDFGDLTLGRSLDGNGSSDSHGGLS